MSKPRPSLLSALLYPLAKRAATRHWQSLVSQILAAEKQLETATKDELRRQSLSLRYRVHSGEPLDAVVAEAFALVREAAARTLGMRHYPVQLLGGVAMHFGSIAEMQTGEGKTLTATLPLFVAALEGKGAQLATANDYLATRDAETMRPLFELLGMSVGVIETQTSRPQRQRAYQSDITYGTAKEFGFDFLRDRLLDRHTQGRADFLGRMLGLALETQSATPVQRELHFVLVDEADSILIDEARTPLIISSLPGHSQQVAVSLYGWAARVAPKFEEPLDYEYDHKRREVTLVAAGRRRVREFDKPLEIAEVDLLDLYEHVERAIQVHRDYLRDRKYVVRNGEIVIVDEFTGRLAEGRKWRDGIHQAIEAKESVEISVKTDEAARITVQDFFLRFQRLAGMTGTAITSRHELRRIYSSPVIVIPTHRTNRRTQWPDVICGQRDAKWRAIVEEVEQLHATGRPILIGTRSIDKSDQLSQMLSALGLTHQVLNARRHAEEAQIIAHAGELGRITVATNMAGRGTDIKLAPGVAELGGLHVILTELHESARIDRQLVGRCARQGDPGSFRRYMALDDELLKTGLGPRKAERLRIVGVSQAVVSPRFIKWFDKAQSQQERLHFRQRRMLLYHEQERRKSQEQMGQDPHLDSPS